MISAREWFELAAMSELRLDSFLPYRLSIASNLASAVIAQSYERMFGLAIGEWRVVALLADHGDLMQRDLVALSRMDKMSVSRAVKPLVARRLVTHADHDGDRRARRLSLTGDGRELHARIVPIARKLESDLLADVTPRERDDLDAILRKIEQAALRLT